MGKVLPWTAMDGNGLSVAGEYTPKRRGKKRSIFLTREEIESVNNLSVRDGAAKLGCSTFTLRKRRLEMNIPTGEVSARRASLFRR